MSNGGSEDDRQTYENLQYAIAAKGKGVAEAKYRNELKRKKREGGLSDEEVMELVTRDYGEAIKRFEKPGDEPELEAEESDGVTDDRPLGPIARRLKKNQ